MSDTARIRIALWVARQITWRNILRSAGLTTMLWLIYTKDHPDPTALLACGAMMGLPSFIRLIEAEPPKRGGDS
jgi:hypothetical protein